MRRVAVVGPGGAGKSVLAVRLGARLGLPVIHLDPLFWKPGWVETPLEEWRAVQEELVQRDAWIIDGNHASTLDVRLTAADTVLVLDFRRARCITRVVWRSLRYRRRARVDRAEGCPERLDRTFLRWVWTFPTVGRPQLFDAIARHGAGADVICLRNPRQVDRFLSALP